MLSLLTLCLSLSGLIQSRNSLCTLRSGLEKAAQVLPHYSPKLWLWEVELGALYSARPGFHQNRAAATEWRVWWRHCGPGAAHQQCRVKRHLLADPGSALWSRRPRVSHHAGPDGSRTGDLREQPRSPHQRLSAAVPLALWSLQGVTAGGRRHHGVSEEDYCKASGNIRSWKPKGSSRHVLDWDVGPASCWRAGQHLHRRLSFLHNRRPLHRWHWHHG